MIAYLINQACEVSFNLINVRIDAYRILKNKTIAHCINFSAYALFSALLCWLARWDVWQIVLFAISAFCNRQLSFDIPLNLRRGLPWDYVSLAKPPKALMDQIEIRVFGYNGRAPILVYASVWVICFVIKIFL